MKIDEKTEVQSSQLHLSSIAEIPEFQSTTEGELLIMATIKAPTFVSEEERAPLEVVGVIDRSGSMQGEKLNLVKHTMEFVADCLQSRDKMSVVVYDDTVSVPFPLTSMDAAGKQKATDVIKKIQVGGCTNLCGGLKTGLDEVRRQRVSATTNNNNNNNNHGTVSSVLLFTDGLANVGPSDSDGILKVAMTPLQDSTNAQEGLPCTVNTFGFGSDHDPKILNTIAQRCDGIYYYVQSANDIAKAFTNCLGGLTSVVGQKIELSLECLNGVTISQTFALRYPEEINEHKTRCVLKLGDIQGEEQRDLLFKLKLPVVKGSVTEFPLARLTVTYYNTLTKKVETSESVVIVTRPEVSSGGFSRNYALDVEYNRIVAAKAMEEAATLGKSAKYTEAQAVLEKAIQIIQESVSREDSKNVSLVRDLKECKEKMTVHEFQKSGEATIWTNFSSHAQQRQTDFGYEGQTRYATSNRAAISSKYHAYNS